MNSQLAKRFLGACFHLSAGIIQFLFSFNTIFIFLLPSTELVTHMFHCTVHYSLHDNADAGTVLTKVLATVFSVMHTLQTPYK
jgi:hypothetical protein